MALPGTPGQRISDLCNGNHVTQKELAEKIGVSASQLSRIASGETKTVSSDILIGVAREFKVLTDYILGLSTVSVRKSYDISELGLSEGAVKGLVTGAIDVQILNRLMEHRAEARRDLQLLNAQKIGEHEAEIEKIKSAFLTILRDIKKDMESGKQPEETVAAAMFQTMRDALDEQKQSPLSIDEVTATVAGQIAQLAPMDEETAGLFQKLAKKMIEQAGK